MPLRLTFSALGEPVAGRLRLLRRRLRGARAWQTSAGRRADMGRLPDGYLYGDGEAGRRLAHGEWAALGHVVRLGPRSIWSVPLPDPRLEAERDAFAWLGDLAACGTRAARSRAQGWTLEWIARQGRGRGPGWSPERAGQRVLAWVAHGRFLLDGLPETDASRFWQALAAHGRALAEGWREAPPGPGQVRALAGAAMALALTGDDGAEAATIALAYLSEAAIDGSGGTASRAPGDLAEIVIALIWSARVLENAGQPAKPGHLHAIARAVPVLRALRLGDGSMARFHGGGPGEPHRIDQALAELRLATRAKPRLPMGYARLAGGRLIAVMDGAAPPTGPGQVRGAAATLAFELSSGRVPLVVNQGPGHVFGRSDGMSARATASYSTVEIDGASSARLCRQGIASRTFGAWLAAGPSLVSVRQAQDHTGQWLLATHDGFVETFGLLHERRLFVGARGTECRGEEIVYVTDGRAQRRFDAAARRRGGRIALAAHFHLHPDTGAAVDPVRQVVELRPPGGEVWIFRAAGGRVEVRDSRHFDPAAAEPLSCLRIVVIAEVMDYLGQINWSFTRAASPPRGDTEPASAAASDPEPDP